MKNIRTSIIIFLAVFLSFGVYAQCNVESEKLSTNMFKYSMSELIFQEDPSEAWFFAIPFNVNLYCDKSRTGVNYFYELVPTLITDWQELPVPNILVIEFQSGTKIELKAKEKSYNTLNGNRINKEGLTSVECTFTPSYQEINLLRNGGSIENITYTDYRTGRSRSPPLQFKGIIAEMLDCVTRQMDLDKKLN